MTLAERVVWPGHCWINNQGKLNTDSYSHSPAFKLNLVHAYTNVLSTDRAQKWRRAPIPHSPRIFRKLSRKTSWTALCAGINQLASTTESAHVKVVKASSSARFETALRTRVEEITTALWTEITVAAALRVDFRNASAPGWKKKVASFNDIFFRYFNVLSCLMGDSHNIYVLKKADKVPLSIS